MELFFQISVSVFCVVATVFMLTLFVWATILRVQINKLIKKLDEISVIAKDTAVDTKEFIERTTKSLEAFKNSIFTFEFVRKIMTEVVGLIKNYKKGTKDGQEK